MTTMGLLRAWALAITLLFTLQAAAEESRLDMVMKRDKLIVATYSTAPPLAFTDDKGQLVGFEVEIARLIAKELLGSADKIEFVVIQSAGRFPSVLSGRADFAIAATTIYPERAARVAFTTPYMDSGVAVLVRRDANARTLADLNNPKFTMAGQNNPQNAERAQRFVPKAKTVWFDSPSELLLAVKSGRATAIQLDSPVADYFALQNKDLHVLSDMVEALGVSNNAIFMKPGDFTWWLYLDTVIKELRFGSRYPEYSEMHRKWFGKEPPPQRFYIGKKK